MTSFLSYRKSPLRPRRALLDCEDYAGSAGGVVPGGFDLGERDDPGSDAEIGGLNRGEGLPDGFEERGEWDALDAAAHEHDGGGAEGCAGEVDGGRSAGFADVDEADGGGIFYGFGDGDEDGFGAFAPEVVNNDVDARGEELL